MTHQQEQQFVAAVLAAGGDHLPRRLGIQPEWLENIEARGGLRAIYEFTDAGHTGVPGEAYLQERLVSLPAHSEAESLESMCEAVRLAQLRRHIVSITHNVNHASAADPRQAATQLMEAISDPAFTTLISDAAEERFHEGLDEIIAPHVNRTAEDGVVGLPTPWEPMTHQLKGIIPGAFWVIFAPEKNFKSYLALEFVYKAYCLGKRVLIVSSEMTPAELNERILCRACGLDYNRFLDMTLTAEEVQLMLAFRDEAQARVDRTIHHLAPSAHGVQAVEEVRAKIIELNPDGELALTLWDGHYRSAKSDEWTDVYQLVRRSRHVALDARTGRVPMIVTTQEGSEKGKVGYQAYGHEATVMLRARKTAANRAELATVRIRRGRPCKLTFNVDWATSSFNMVHDSTFI